MEAVLYNMPGDFGRRFDMHWGDLIYSAQAVLDRISTYQSMKRTPGDR